MITLDYVVRSAPPPTMDLANIDESALHYDLFLGDVKFRIDDADMSAPWGWVPVVDFAVCIDRIVNELESGETQSFEFTESESRIDFRRQGDEIVIRTTYGAPECRAPWRELRDATRLFLGRVLDELMRAHPSLVRNPSIRRIYPKAISSHQNGSESTER